MSTLHGAHVDGVASLNQWTLRRTAIAIQVGQPREGLDVTHMQPPIVVCVGISAYNLVQELSLPWQPVVIAARHTITWGPDYERTLAEQINGLLSGLVVNKGHMITTAQIS